VNWIAISACLSHRFNIRPHPAIVLFQNPKNSLLSSAVAAANGILEV
jgi:hypothetical protein